MSRDALLNRELNAGDVSSDHIVDLATRLARFHHLADVADSDDLDPTAIDPIQDSQQIVSFLLDAATDPDSLGKLDAIGLWLTIA